VTGRQQGTTWPRLPGLTCQTTGLLRHGARRGDEPGTLHIAAEHYARLPGFADADHRLLLVTGRIAAAEDDWPAAHRAFAELATIDWDVIEALTEARAKLYDQATGETDWATAATHFVALPPDYQDAGTRARYATGRPPNCPTTGQRQNHPMWTSTTRMPGASRLRAARVAEAAENWTLAVGCSPRCPDICSTWPTGYCTCPAAPTSGATGKA